MSEPILTRIRIKWNDGADIAYFTDKDVFDTLGLQPHAEFNDVLLLNIGTVLHLDGGDVKIARVSTNFYRRTYENNENVGINIYGVGERYPFNFEITYGVEAV